jgi:hypothetical protein
LDFLVDLIHPRQGSFELGSCDERQLAVQTSRFFAEWFGLDVEVCPQHDARDEEKREGEKKREILLATLVHVHLFKWFV